MEVIIETIIGIFASIGFSITAIFLINKLSTIIKDYMYDVVYWDNNAEYKDEYMKYAMFTSQEWNDYDQAVIRFHILTRKGYVTYMDITKDEMRKILGD